MKYLFIGEKRSQLAISRGVTWLDGRLAEKQLFDALKRADINPEEQRFINWFEFSNTKMLTVSKKAIKEGFTIVGMGNKVQKELIRNCITHIQIVHPAARGKIRLKENYFNHIKAALKSK